MAEQDRVSVVIEDLNTWQLRKLIELIDGEPTFERKFAPKGYILMKMSKAVYNELIPEEIPGKHNRTFSQFWPVGGKVPNQKYENVRYVAIGRDRETYRSKFREEVVLSGGEPDIKPWVYQRWFDYFGIENVMAGIPLDDPIITEEVEDVIT